ncbi:MAG: bifunctional adenosylcobinamide kinase/adenosylcobinamide-phosphate guanylyltransferase [Streptosporangiaceae bacterium]
MQVLIEGTGGAHGWPEPGCRCASCLRTAADGSARKRSAIVVDGVLRLVAGETEPAAAGYLVRRLPDARGAAGSGTPGRAGVGSGGLGGWDAGSGGLGGWDAGSGGLGGWDVTAPDGGRLLYPAGPGAVPVPPDGAEPYDLAFLDLLGEPAQLGLLRARGLVTGNTVTAVAFADHRVPSEAELRQRCRFWNAAVPGEGEAVTNARSGKKALSGPWRVLVLGGARSGKSERAELRLAGEPDVTYVAAGARGPDPDPDRPDPDWAARVAAHRARRPAWWRTVETTDVAGVLAAADGALLVDGIGTWLAAVLGECGAWDEADGWAERLAERTGELVAAWRQTGAHVVAVSDEAGLGVVPATPAGRRFRDELGRLNQRLAAESDEAELVIAGRILPLAPG